MRFLPELLSRNWTLKLAALGIAVLLWTAVRVEAPDRQSLPGVPVRIQLDDPGWAMVGDPSPPTVELRVGGPGRALFQLALNPPSLVIPVDQVHVGDTTIAVRRDWVRIQDRPGVVVEDVQPSTVRLSFEPLENAAVPLVVPTTGDLDEELALAGELSTNPAVVRVSGPRSRVRELDSIPLRPLDLGGVDGTGTHRMELAVDTTGLSDLSFSPLEATVSVRVDDRVERVVEGVPVTLEAEGLLVQPPAMDVILRGPRSLLESGGSIEVSLAVPESALEGIGGAEDRRVQVEVRGLPDFVRALPASDSVLVRRRSSS